jgi:hypothetical protein
MAQTLLITCLCSLGTSLWQVGFGCTFFASSWVYVLGSAANDAERGGIAKIFHLPVQPGDIDVAGRAGDGNSNWPAAMPAAADC